MTTNSARTYSSPLREAQAEQTRERIIDAALRVLGDRGAAFTMPAVAKEAEVSLPTVYRLFPNKESLTNVASEAVRSRFGVDSTEVDDIDDVLQRQRQHIINASEADERLLRALYTLNAEPLSAADVASREEFLERVVNDAVAGLQGEDRVHFSQILSIIFSSTTGMALWRFRLLNDEGADLIDWVVRTLISGMQNTQGER